MLRTGTLWEGLLAAFRGPGRHAWRVEACTAVLVLLGAFGAPELEEPPEAPVREGLNERFLSPELDVAEFVETFEGESREIALARDALARAVGLAPGMAVADVGAGTGLFLAPFAAAVGPGGVVYAVEISEGFASHLRARARDEGLAQVEVVLCDERDSRLPPASVDRVFVCDTYHHFTYPRTTLASLRRALRPGGRLVVVDFERIPGVSRAWTLDHVRAGKDTFRAEIEEAGFRFLEEVAGLGLEENYCLVFARD